MENKKYEACELNGDALEDVSGGYYQKIGDRWAVIDDITGQTKDTFKKEKNAIKDLKNRGLSTKEIDDKMWNQLYTDPRVHKSLN